MYGNSILGRKQETLQNIKITPENKDVVEEQKRKIFRTKITKSSEYEKYRKECEVLEYELEAGRQASVVVSHWAYTGVSVTINGATNNVKEDVKGITFSLRKGNVIMNYND